jgi:hypothetical protein
MTYSLLWLPQVLRDAGLEVLEHAGCARQRPSWDGCGRRRSPRAYHRGVAMRKILLTDVAGGLLAALLIGSIKAHELDVLVRPPKAAPIG